MAEIVRLPIVPKTEPSVRIDVSVDDYSIRATSPADDIFWVRIDLPVGDVIQVSDFNPGKLGDDALYQALSLVLGNLPRPQTETLLFKDIAPGSASPQRALAIASGRSRIEKAAERLAAQRGHKVERIGLEEYRGKVNVRVTFKRKTGSV